MSTSVATRQEIQQAIERLPEDHRPAPTSTAPIYQVHRQAIATGVPDLAHQHDHYLYGLEKGDD